MERRADLSAREQLQDAVLHAPDDAPFEPLRKQLEGALTAPPPYVVGAIQLPEYMAVSQAAIAHDGTIALVGITKRDDLAELRLWHPRNGLGDVLEIAPSIEHVHFPTGSTQQAYVAISRSSEGIRHTAVWGNLRFECSAPMDSFRAMTSSVEDAPRFVMTCGGSVFWETFRTDLRDMVSISGGASGKAMLLGFARGEPVVMETSEGQRSQRRVRCGEWTSEWFDGVWYRGVDESGGVEIFARRLVDGKMGLWLVSPQGVQQLASSIDPGDMFATNGRLFEVFSVHGRSHLRDLPGTFVVKLPTEISVRKVVCDGARVHVYGLFERFSARRRNEPRYTQFDLATGEVLRDEDVQAYTSESLREVGGRALLIGKHTFEDVSADVPWVYPHYGHPDRLTPVDGGLASWHFVDGTLYALLYELAPVIS